MTEPDDPYRPLAGRSRYVIAQLGQSLDGRIATVSGHSQYVTGETDRRHLHCLRARVDAVVIGASTVLADDPQLTVRLISPPARQPTRVVLDPSRRIRDRRRVLMDGQAPTLLCRPPDADGVPGMCAGLLALPVTDTGFDPGQHVQALAERGLRRLLVEGGGRLVSSFLQQGLLDHLYLTVAPVIIGSGVQGLGLPPIERMDQALRPAVQHYRLGEDVLFRLDFPVPGTAGYRTR